MGLSFLPDMSLDDDGYEIEEYSDSVFWGKAINFRVLIEYLD